MSVFWALVGNDVRWGAKSITKKFNWSWVYFIAAILFGMVQYTIFLINAKDLFSFDPRCILPYFLLVFIINSGKIISSEKRRDTIGWWLSLPYSRKMLLGAKLTASFFRFLKFLAIVVITIAILFFEACVIRPDLLTGSNISSFLFEFFQLILLLLALCPCAIIAGIILRLVNISNWRPAAPLFWICIITGYSFLGSSLLNLHSGKSIGNKIYLVFNSELHYLPLLILIEIFIFAVLGFVSLYLLENQVEV